MNNIPKCITEDEPVSRLREAWLLEIGRLLSSDISQNWIVLATRLGLSNEEIEHIRITANPGYEVLRLWKTRQKSTLRVLSNALKYMNRYDVIALLDKAMTDPTDVTIVVKYMGQVNDEITVNGEPAMTILLNLVRPRIYRKFSSLMLRGRLSVRLVQTPGPVRSWTSPVGEFRGQEIEVELVLIPDKKPFIKERTETEYSGRQYYLVDRDCQSCIEGNELVFDLIPQEASGTTAENDSLMNSSLSSLGSLSLHSDPSCILNEVATNRGQNQPVQSPTSTGVLYARLPGFHPEIPNDGTRRGKVAELLGPHLDENGAYILRKGTIAESCLTLSVVFDRDILHFFIMQTKGKERFYVFADGCEFDTVADLIHYYKSHSLSAPSAIIDTNGLYLGNPIL